MPMMARTEAAHRSEEPIMSVPVARNGRYGHVGDLPGSEPEGEGGDARPEISFDTRPEVYRHLRLEIDGEVARIVLRVDERGGLLPGYELKLNSYDLGVDIELYDAVQRLRFEHPEVGAVLLTSAKERVFCAGANIRMLGKSSHAWKVNFCKFTNETRNSLEEASTESGQAWVCM